MSRSELPPPLAHIVVPAPGAGSPEPLRTAFVLHGILGSGRNWLSFMRRFASRVPGWRFVLVDLRGHGDSHACAPPHTLAASAADLHALATHLGGAPEAVIGHSFGGKVALAYARDWGGPTLRQCWVLDASPGASDPDAVRAAGGDTHEVVDVLAVLRSLDTPIVSRAALQDTLRARCFGESFTGWMTTNVRPLPEGGFEWRFDFGTVSALLASYFEADLWPFVQAPRPGLALHLVRAERSDRWRAGDRVRLDAAIAAGVVAEHVVSNAGHWLHVDNPDGLMVLLAAGLKGSQQAARSPSP